MKEIDDLKKLLKNHEKRISELENLMTSRPSVSSLNDENVILNLIKNRFFDSPKKYGDLITELKRQAKYQKTSKYREILTKLTQEDKLERKISDHQWKYIKK